MTGLPSNTVPPSSVLDAFGVEGTPVPLAGGQGHSVRVGGFVFKPADGTEEEVEWAASVFERLAPGGSGFRVPAPLRAADGQSVVEGWTACEFLDGEPGPRGRWSDVISAGRAFHVALRKLPRPGFLDRQTHPWAVADRVAWGEEEAKVAAGLAGPLSALLELRRPVEQVFQLIHGDLTGNVLFAAGEEPAVIDFSPYWRPPLFAEAIVVADGLLWFDPPPDLLVAGSGRPGWRQMLVRALIFRLVAYSELVGPSEQARADEAARYVRATEAVRHRLADA
ncbi:phosphotransferase [Streptomyces atacamensis]|uniref:phosphotransferase n=1 Tax=Streptomyces atacamensis TaxID=531966 RepID=UPI00399C4B99